MNEPLPSLSVSRFPWPDDFPDVILHTSLELRNHHPDYPLAKSGDRFAALRLAYDLMDPQAMEQIKSLVYKYDAIITPVTAIEVGGYNAIPDAMAVRFLVYLERPLGEDHYYHSGEILQSNKVAHTRAKGFWRFVTPPQFGGDVRRGRNYFLVDDHIGHGGTLANLRGFIEVNGGKVIGISTLTETRGAKQIRLDRTVHDMLLSKYGENFDTFWRKTYGYGLECLTNVEAGFLYRQSSFEQIRASLAEATGEVRASGLFAVEAVDAISD